MRDDLSVEQSQRYEGDDWWTWAVWLDGDQGVLNEVDFVEWTLHPTFPTPIRKVHDRTSQFRLETAGWGVFPIIARVQMKDGTQVKLRHQLKLTYPDGSSTAE